ncbi:FkbM family methyltransferase [Streptomyces zhihengii]|uniref:FkbM family methyltransferase n=1 Tax=Streptomyces zhihengii TaxID=1818004 RepID=UPI0035574C83
MHTVRSAASDTTGALTLYLEDPSNLGHTTAIRPATSTRPPRSSSPLSDLISRADLATTRVIKIDVEGAEAAAIRGRLPALPYLRADAELVVEVTPRLRAKQGESAAAIIATLRTHGFHPYTLTNDYDPATYPRAMRGPQPPIRCTTTPKDMTDLVFAHTDATSLPLAP